MEAFFFFLTLSLMVFRIFVKSLFLELCTRISALILKKHNELLSSQLSPKPSGKCYLILLTPEVLLS